ncbi:PAS domain-containing protein [Roseomonas elaeocarpi]|uniref:histidine kinase n=1 Tax=Roseomonas elaeocarpi TaxID=907779 RepID=A0ABV6JWJ7_9PROT
MELPPQGEAAPHPPPSYKELAQRVVELTAANRALRREADQMSLIAESATDYAIIALNLGGRITGWNSGAERLLGHTEAQALGRSGAIVFTAEDRADGVFVSELWRAFDQGSAPNERWHVRRDGTRFWAVGAMVPLLDDMGRVSGFLNIMRDGTAARDAEKRTEFLLAEARHKVKNIFAAVYALAARHAGAGGDFGPAFNAQLAALARSHELLDASAATLAEVIGRSLEPYGATGQTQAAGPPVPLNPCTATALNSIFHELATNAAKYGAFSTPEGRVEVSWVLEPAEAGGPSEVVVTWRETGGPPVSQPVHRGFGSRVIERSLAAEEGGSAQLDFRPEGVICLIRLRCEPGLS